MVVEPKISRLFLVHAAERDERPALPEESAAADFPGEADLAAVERVLRVEAVENVEARADRRIGVRVAGGKLLANHDLVGELHVAIAAQDIEAIIAAAARFCGR